MCDRKRDFCLKCLTDDTRVREDGKTEYCLTHTQQWWTKEKLEKWYKGTVIRLWKEGFGNALDHPYECECIDCYEWDSFVRDDGAPNLWEVMVEALIQRQEDAEARYQHSIQLFQKAREDCLLCGKPLTKRQKSRRGKYCSRSCQRIHLKRRDGLLSNETGVDADYEDRVAAHEVSLPNGAVVSGGRGLGHNGEG